MDHIDNLETLLARWLSGELTADELEALQQRDDFADLRQIVAGMEGLAPPGFDVQAAWERLASAKTAAAAQTPELPATAEPPAAIEVPPAPLPATLEAAPQMPAPPVVAEQPMVVEEPTPPVPPRQEGAPETPVRRLVPWKRYLSMAAAVAALAVAGWWLFGGSPESRALRAFDEQVTTKAGEQQEVTLPDGSVAVLNARSTLGFSKSEWPKVRQVGLTGEAFFRVKKGNDFTVETVQGSVRVVGTKFNVFARGKEMEVKCTEGKVQVVSPRKQKALLKGGEQIAVLDGRLQKRRGLEFTPKWFDGESVFRSAPLPRVFDELERQFGLTVIEGDSLGGRSFSGKFRHDDVQKAIKAICQPMQLDCSLVGDTLRVGGK